MKFRKNSEQVIVFAWYRILCRFGGSFHPCLLIYHLYVPIFRGGVWESCEQLQKVVNAKTRAGLT